MLHSVGTTTNDRSTPSAGGLRRRHRRLLAALALPVTVVLGCSGGEPTTPLAPCPAEETLSISVSGQEVPSISWEPTCLVGRLFVTPPPSLGTYQHAWHVQSMTGGFAPPVRYGQVPEGATASNPALPLQEGVGYTVTLFRMDGSSAGSTLLVR